MKVIGTVVNLGINVLILVSTVAFCVSTMEKHSDDCNKNPEKCEEYKVLWTYIELFCVSVFTLDILVRGIAGYKAGKWEEVKGDAMNWIDLFAILPFYVQLVIPSDYDLRFLRVIRLARILKLMEASGYGNVGGTVWEIMRSSSMALIVPMYFMCLALIVCSALMYKAEQTVSKTCINADGVFPDWDTARSSPGNEGCLTEVGCQCSGELVYITRSGEEWSSEIFDSIPHCFWWCIVTFTTVGYGDISPRTAAGQWLNVGTMILGIFFLAMPIAIIGEAFTHAWGKVEALRREKKTQVAAADDAVESLVHGFGEPHTEVKSIGHTEHDIKRHMIRAKKYLVVLNQYDTMVGKDGRKPSTVAVGLLEEAESIFDAAVQLFKSGELEQRKLRVGNTAKIDHTLDGDGRNLISGADQALTSTMGEAQQWAETHGDPALRMGAKLTGAAAGLGYGIAKQAGGKAMKTASSAASSAGDRMVQAASE